jgi:hypothetical protein
MSAPRKNKIRDSVGLSASCAAQAHHAAAYSLFASIEGQRDGREPRFATPINPASAEILMMASIHCMAV